MRKQQGAFGIDNKTVLQTFLSKFAANSSRVVSVGTNIDDDAPNAVDVDWASSIEAETRHDTDKIVTNVFSE